jgi:hypothetical protein
VSGRFTTRQLDSPLPVHPAEHADARAHPSNDGDAYARPPHPRAGVAGETAFSTRNGLSLGVLAVIGIGLPLVVSSLTNSLTIPHNDDWAYSRVAETFGFTGHITLVGWNRAFLVGQFAVLGPLARWILAQHLFVAATGVVAIVATFAVLHQRVGRRRALLGSAVVALWPGFGLLATSFMGDVPCFAAMMVALALGDAAVRRTSPRLFVCALGVAIWGVTVREQALAAFVAVSIAGLSAIRMRRVVTAVIAGSIVLLALEAWRRSLAHGDSPAVHLVAIPDVARLWARAYFTLAAPLLPLTLTVALRSWRRSSWVAAIIVGAAGLKLALSYGTGLFIGNYFTRHVAYQQASLGGPVVIPRFIWLLVVIASVCSGAVLAGAVVSRWRRIDRTLGTFTLISLLLIVLPSIVNQPVFDRYLLVLVPACVVLTTDRSEIRHVLVRSYAALAGIAAISVLILSGTLAYDGARWRTARNLGISSTNVDAGLEWVGWHASLPARSPEGDAPASSFYRRIFPQSHNCYVVTGSSAKAVGQFIREYQYSWLFDQSTLRLWRRC